VLFRSWAQISEAFIAGQVNVVHLLSPIAIWSGIGLGIIRGAIDDIRVSDRSLLDSNRYLPNRADELTKELTRLQAETEVLGSTPLDPVPEYSQAVMRLRPKSAELASQAAQSALLHAGARGFIVSSAPQRRIREAMFGSDVLFNSHSIDQTFAKGTFLRAFSERSKS
jgi:hypothetical protein